MTWTTCGVTSRSELAADKQARNALNQRMSFRPSLVAFSRQKPSAWITRQNKDPYVKQRASDPARYRSRSAFKLLEIDELYNHFLTKADVKAVVDLGAAPGGWSQVVAAKLGYSDTKSQKQRNQSKGKRPREWGMWSSDKKPEEDTFDPLNIEDEMVSLDGGTIKRNGIIIAVDLLRMQHIPGVEFVQGDFLASQTVGAIQTLLKLSGSSDGLVDIVLSDMAANLSGNDTRDIESSLEICNAVFEFAKRNLRTAESTGRRNAGVLV